jgi:RNA-binding protein Musashi
MQPNESISAEPRGFFLSSHGVKIDPKRAIPRDEQEKTSKIFVGGVSQEATEQDFKQFFMQFGRVVDATLMIDKDTGRPRGFGFVTFDSEAAVEATLSRPLEILGKPIEVKKAQPRSNMRDEEDRRGRRGRGDGTHGVAGDSGQQQQTTQGQAGLGSGISPQMMAQYWQRMQQYFAVMQQQMAVAAASQGQGMSGMGIAGMNPALMQQMQQMKQMQMGGGQPQGHSPSPGPQGMQNMMTPAMMQQIQQMQQMPNQGQGGNLSGMGGQMAAGMGMGGGMGGSFPGVRSGPGYNAQEQLAFEQQKYEQQQQVRRVMENRGFSPYQQGGPTSWEGMYDEVPQPNIPTGPQGVGRDGAMGLGMGQNQTKPPQTKATTPQPMSTAPANAPTGPKNAGRPGANYRGGGRGGGHRGFHPYAR